MANNAGGALLRGAAAAVRRLSNSAANAAAAAAAGANEGQMKCLYRRLSALGNAPKGSVAKTLNQWLREGRRVTGVDAIRFATKLRKYGRFRQALEVMEWMDARGIIMHYGDYGLRLHLISKVGGIASAEKYFSRLSVPARNLDTYEALLSCYCTAKMEDKAIALYDKMKKLNYLSSFVYNNLMTLHMKLEQPEKVPPLLQQMMAEKVAPSTITYTLVLNSYASLRDIEAVEQLVKVTKEQDADMLKWSFYGNLASFYISSGLVEKAEPAVKMLEKTMDIHDQTCYHFLISLYSRIGNLVEVKRVWNHLKASFPMVTNTSYFVTLSALDKLNDLDALTHYFEEWESRCLAYDIKLAILMVKAYLRRGMISYAESVLKDAILKSPAPVLYIFQVFIDYFLEKQRTGLALKYVEDAVVKVKDQVWKPSKGQVKAFLRFLQDRNVDGSEAFVDSLKKLDSLDLDSHDVLGSAPSASEGKPSLHQLFQSV